MELRVLALYPDQMNIYADRGNIVFLRRRCEWRGIGFAYPTAGPGEAFDPGAHDLLYLGGGQDRDQRAVAADMVATKRDALAAAVDDGAVMLAVCGGYQLLGHSYQLGDERLPGIGLADITTVREPGPRLIGNVAIEADLGEGPRTIAGFENHGGRTHLGASATPLGRVISGVRQQRRGRPRGGAPRQPDRHLPPWPAAAQERLARRPPDRARARAPLRQPAPSSSRWTTRSSSPRPSPRACGGDAQLSAPAAVRVGRAKMPNRPTRRAPARVPPPDPRRRPARRRCAQLRRRAGNGRQRNHRHAVRRHDPRCRAASRPSTGKAATTSSSASAGTTASSAAKETTASSAASVTIASAAVSATTGSPAASAPTRSTAKPATTSIAATRRSTGSGIPAAAPTRSASRPGQRPGFPNQSEFFEDAGFPAGDVGRGVYVDLGDDFANDGLAPVRRRRRRTARTRDDLRELRGRDRDAIRRLHRRHLGCRDLLWRRRRRSDRWRRRR